LTAAISILNGTTASFTSALKSTYDGYATSKVNKADSTGVNGYATQDDLLTKVNKADSTGVHGYATQDDLNSKESTITTLSIVKGGTNNATPAQNKFLIYNGTKYLASGKDSTSFILATNLDTDTTLTANSDTKVASQKAIKTYISHNTSATQLRGKGVSAAFVDGYRLYYDAAKDSLMWTGSTGSVGNADSLGNQPAAYYIARSDSTDATSYTTKKQFNDGQLLKVNKADSTGVNGYATQDDLLGKQNSLGFTALDKADTTDATSYTTKKQFNDGQLLDVKKSDSTGVNGYATQNDLLEKQNSLGYTALDKADSTDAVSYTTKKQFNDGQALKINLADSSGVHGYTSGNDFTVGLATKVNKADSTGRGYATQDDLEKLTRIMEFKLILDGTAAAITDSLIFCIPFRLNGYNLIDADAFVTTVSSSGTPTFTITNVTDSQSMLSTNITIDATEFTSYTAATAPVINTSYDDVATGDRIKIKCTVTGTGTKGSGVILVFQKP
jgi:hypothetical protein